MKEKKNWRRKVSFVKRHRKGKYERKNCLKISLLIGSVFENCDPTSKFFIIKPLKAL